jgi:hypothetical protein
MPRKGHSPEQVLNKLRQVEVAVAGGKSVGVCQGRSKNVPLRRSKSGPPCGDAKRVSGDSFFRVATTARLSQELRVCVVACYV